MRGASEKKRRRSATSEEQRGEAQASNAAHADLCAKVKSNDRAKGLRILEPVIIASCHDKVIKTSCISPGGKLTTCDLGGRVKFWRLKGQDGAIIHKHTSTWPVAYPEEMAWHPDDERLFAVFRSEPHQVGFTSEAMKDFKTVNSFPHTTGSLRCIQFMPWKSADAACFATGGDDHAVVLWSEKQGEWKGEVLYKRHTSTVYGLTGNLSKNWILSAGVDRKLMIHDVVQARNVCEAKLDHMLLDIKSNPVDPNLVFIAMSAGEKQIRLHDLRCFDTEKWEHAFGWDVDKPSVTRKIHQCWSQDGLYVSSGTLENRFHVFDIRYNGCQPAATVQGHDSFVLKAEWHPVVTKMVISTTRDGHIWLQDFH